MKTFHQHRVYGTSIVTLLTVQNTQTVDDVRVLDPDFVVAQLDAVVADIPPGAAKTGALGSAAVIEAVAVIRLLPFRSSPNLRGGAAGYRTLNNIPRAANC